MPGPSDPKTMGRGGKGDTNAREPAVSWRGGHRCDGVGRVHFAIAEEQPLLLRLRVRLGLGTRPHTITTMTAETINAKTRAAPWRWCPLSLPDLFVFGSERPGPFAPRGTSPLVRLILAAKKVSRGFESQAESYFRKALETLDTLV